jgi:cellulose synthase/poly-beta-1,6-N-acetylglucosamine synthase-like glycosyltransferase
MLTDYERYRIYEFLPGLSVWLTLIIALVLSFVKPLWMIYAIIIFDVYWVLRVGYFAFYLILSWRRFRKAVRIEWFKKLALEVRDWASKVNVVFLPVYNEGWEVVRTTLQALAKSSYPANRIYVVVSGEGRQLAHWQELQEKIRTHFGNVFAEIICYTHPAGLKGEIPGKGSNIHFAEHQFKKYADQKGWRYQDIIISVFDIDTVVHKEYIGHLTYLYCLHPRPERSSFQPLTLYNNNLWESPAILRIMALGTSFWMLFSMARLDNLVTFSSHSMSFKAALDVGGHAKDIVSEDSRIFYQCWLHYNGDYEVTPLYVPVSMDTVRDDKPIKSLKNLYYQQRRWAWGSEHIPYLLWEFKKHSKIPWFKKFIRLFHEWEGKWSWALVAILLTLLSQLPIKIAGETLRQSALFFNTPQVLNILMTTAMLGLLVSMIMSMLILPARPDGHRPHKYLYLILQWALLPVSLILFSAIPCISAMTHLMFGKYLGFNVSAKKRSSS